MRNENSLKARVQRDAEFFKHLLADVPARQVMFRTVYIPSKEDDE